MIGSRMVAVLCLLALALPLHHQLVEADRGDSTKEKKNQRDTCHKPLKETPDNGDGSNYPCMLTKHLRHLRSCGCVEMYNAPGTYGFSVSEQQALMDLIVDVEVTLEGYGGVINDSCVVEIGLKLQIFFEAHANIKASLSFQSMFDSDGVFWGTIQDFVSVHIEIQFEICDPILQVGPDFKCELHRAIEASAAASGNQKIIDECHNATRHMQSLLKHTEYNITEQLSFIYQILIEQCSEETLVFLSSHCEISGFGSFRSILNVCKVNFRIQKMHKYMRGSDSNDCDFLADLEYVRSVTCYSGSANSSVCSSLLNLIDKIKLRFSTSIEIEFRMEMCASDIWDFCKLTPWICNCGLPKGGCSIYDILYSSAFCHNEGCCDWNDSPPELPECSCETSSESGSWHGSSSGSGSSSGGSSSASGSGSSSMETDVPCDVESGSGSCESGEFTGPGTSGEEPTPPACVDSGSGSCESGEFTGPGTSGEEPTASVPAETTLEVTVPSASTPEPSTPAVTTPSPPAQTTAAPVSHCEDRANIIKIDISCNCTSFFLSITKKRDTMPLTEKQSWNPVISQIQKIIYDTSLSAAQKIAQIFAQLDGYKPTNTSYRTDFFAITIYQADMVTVWGTLGDFFTCGSSCTCASG